MASGMSFAKLVTFIILALATGILAAPVSELQTDIGVGIDGDLNGNPLIVSEDDTLALMPRTQATGRGVSVRKPTPGLLGSITQGLKGVAIKGATSKIFDH